MKKQYIREWNRQFKAIAALDENYTSEGAWGFLCGEPAEFLEIIGEYGKALREAGYEGPFLETLRTHYKCLRDVIRLAEKKLAE